LKITVEFADPVTENRYGIIFTVNLWIISDSEAVRVGRTYLYDHLQDELLGRIKGNNLSKATRERIKDTSDRCQIISIDRSS
jgi:hypothetical protein